MKKEWLVKTLAMGIVVLFIGVSCSSAISPGTKIPVINNHSENNKSYVDPNIYLDRSDLPRLKRSLDYFRNSDFYDVEIGKILEEIIDRIEIKGKVDSEDIEEILVNSGISSADVFANCKIRGFAQGGKGYVYPLQKFQVLTQYILLFSQRIIGIGGFLYWEAFYHYWNTIIDITVGSKIYTDPHIGNAFGFIGKGTLHFPIPAGDLSLDIKGHALIVFVYEPE